MMISNFKLITLSSIFLLIVFSCQKTNDKRTMCSSGVYQKSSVTKKNNFMYCGTYEVAVLLQPVSKAMEPKFLLSSVG